MKVHEQILNIKLLDPYVVNILKKGGWSEDRYYDMKYWIHELTIEGYVYFEYALDILENLGGLTFHVKDDCNHKGAQFDFNPFLRQMENLIDLHSFNYWQKKSYFQLAACVQQLCMLVEAKIFIGVV